MGLRWLASSARTSPPPTPLTTSRLSTPRLPPLSGTSQCSARQNTNQNTHNMDSETKTFISVDGAKQRPVLTTLPHDAAHPAVPGSARSRGSLCLVSTCLAFSVSISIAALVLAAQVLFPVVWLSLEPASPSGYYFGGATYQGSGTWINKVQSTLPSGRSDMPAVPVGGKVRGGGRQRDARKSSRAQIVIQFPRRGGQPSRQPQPLAPPPTPRADLPPRRARRLRRPLPDPPVRHCL